jgi:TolB protein
MASFAERLVIACRHSLNQLNLRVFVGLSVLAIANSACGAERIEPAGPRPDLTGKMVFASSPDAFGPGHIEAMNADGSARVSLTTDAADDRAPVWSPDGTKIAFVRRSGEAYGIYVMNADGTGQTQLSRDPTANDSGPAWSPDGKRLVFDRHARGKSSSGPAGIYVMSADGSGLTRLTHPPAQQIAGEDFQDYAPAWSHDGQRIAFVRGVPRAQTSIYVMKSDGTGVTRITAEKQGDYGIMDGTPAWSPYGKRIAFDRQDGSRTSIFVVSPNGSGLTRLTTRTDSANPTWSPSGSAIAFTSNRDGGGGFGLSGWQIYVMNANGTGVIRITHDAAEHGGPSWLQLDR